MPRASKSQQSPSEQSALHSNTISDNSRKRKLCGQPKYYAVRAGHRPGIYTEWKDCEKNITKFKGAAFKTFSTRADAEAFVAGREPGPSSNSPAIEKFYGVASGHVPGVYTDWGSAQKQIIGYKGPKYKKFATREEAQAFVKSGGRDTKAASSSVKPRRTTQATDKSSAGYIKVGDEVSAEIWEDDMSEVPSKKFRRDADSAELVVEPGLGKRNALQSVSHSVERIGASMTGQKSAIRIYTDGSSRGNGKVGASAGVGVFFGNGDPRSVKFRKNSSNSAGSQHNCIGDANLVETRNVSEHLEGGLQTNQRAELTAILRALEIAPTNQEVHIYTDSRYSIDCVTNWYKNWEKNKWMTSVKKPVLNKDLIQGTVELIRAREASGARTEFIWVKGHSTDPGNEAADRLAVNGAMMPPTR